MIRNTTGWEFKVDAVLAEKGHAPCGGWKQTVTGEIVCFCDENFGAAEALLAEVLAEMDGRAVR